MNAPFIHPRCKLLLCILCQRQGLCRRLGRAQETGWFVIFKNRGILAANLVYSRRETMDMADLWQEASGLPNERGSSFLYYLIWCLHQASSQEIFRE